MLLSGHLKGRIYIVGDQLKRQLGSLMIKLQENRADGSGEREPFSRGPTGDTAWRHLPPFRRTSWERDPAKVNVRTELSRRAHEEFKNGGGGDCDAVRKSITIRKMIWQMPLGTARQTAGLTGVTGRTGLV